MTGSQTKDNFGLEGIPPVCPFDPDWQDEEDDDFV